MGRPVPPLPVKLFVGVLCSDESISGNVRRELESVWGEVDFESRRFPFDLTRYYEPEMGSGLVRWFWSFERLIDPGTLAEIKLTANNVEERYLWDHGGRKINLDPGYLDFHKVVLASVKERAQKIYLAKGVYADPTLYYLKGTFHAYEWTLPDFKTPLYHSVFQTIRKKYRDQVKTQRLCL